VPVVRGELSERVDQKEQPELLALMEKVVPPDPRVTPV